MQVNPGAQTCKRVGNPTTGRSTSQRTVRSRSFPGWVQSRQCPFDSNRGGVDDGEGSRVGGSGERQADYCRAADGVCDEVATRLHSRVLVRPDGSVVTLIVYRPGPLRVVPPRTGLCSQLRTPKRKESVNVLPGVCHVCSLCFGKLAHSFRLALRHEIPRRNMHII